MTMTIMTTTTKTQKHPKTGFKKIVVVLQSAFFDKFSGLLNAKKFNVLLQGEFYPNNIKCFFSSFCITPDQMKVRYTNEN